MKLDLRSLYKQKIVPSLIEEFGYKNIEQVPKLVKISDGNVAAFVFVINLFDLGGCKSLIEKGYKVENLIEFPGH